MKSKWILILLPYLAIAQGSTIAPEIWSHPREISIINDFFPEGVHTPYINSDATMLYFESGGKIYFIEKIDTVWSSPIQIDKIGDNGYVQMPKISPDHTKLFFLEDDQLFYLQRKDRNSEWDEILDCGTNINNDSTFIEAYVIQNDTTLYIRSRDAMLYSVYNKYENKWGSLIKSDAFGDEFYSWNFGGDFITPDNSKVYHTSTLYYWWEVDGRIMEVFRDYLAVRYKNSQNCFGSAFELNINTDIDSIYALKKVDNLSYSAIAPSLSADGRNLFFAVNCLDTTKIYHSELLLDANAVKDKSIESPSNFILCANYPNPFNPETTIKYALPAGQSSYHVVIKIVDALGRVVQVLKDTEQSPGLYSIQWNAQDNPSGVYFCVIQAGEYKTVRKMLLMR